jgi:hypothetical protein
LLLYINPGFPDRVWISWTPDSSQDRRILAIHMAPQKR